MGLKYEEVFEDWEIAIAVRLVSRFRAERRVLEREDFEDLLQECLAHWYSSRDKYDPSRDASRQTFMSRVLTNKLKDLAKARTRDMRRASYEAVSLDAPIREDEPGRTFLDLIDDAAAEVAPEEPIVMIPFRMRLKKAWARLSGREQELCRLRMDGLDMTKAMKAMGISKDKAYEMRKRIQKIFEQEKLRGYFK